MPLGRDRLALYRKDALFGNNWRYDAGLAEDYHDGNQYDAETARQMEEKGMPLTVVNICRDMVQTVVGLQERSKRDYIVRAEGDEYDALAEALSMKLHEAERITDADRACLDAAEAQNRSGIGWVEVGRSSGLLEYPYFVKYVDWREIWWDPRSKSSDIVSDAEYVRRLRFVDKAAIAARFPKKVKEIEDAGYNDSTVGWYEPEVFLRDYAFRDITHVSSDLWGANRDLVPLEEIYYRTVEKAYAIRLPNGQWAEFREDNPYHMQAYERGLVEPKLTTVKRMNRALYVGDYVLVDGRSPYPHNEFPYTAFVYAREARTGAPYGLIRVVQTLQDQVNIRWSRAMYALNHTQVIYDKGAIEDPDILAEEVGRMDSMIEMAEGRKPHETVEITRGGNIAREQFAMMDQAMNLMPQLGSVPRTLSGIREPGIQSGVAMDRMIDQGMNSQGKPNALFQRGRRTVGWQLLSLIIEDMGDKPQVIETKNKNGTKKIRVEVNVPRQHETGLQYIENDLRQIRLKVDLDDVPQTTTFRMQQFQEIARAISDIQDERVKAIALPYLIEMSDAPFKHEMARTLRKEMGMATDMSPEEEQQLQQNQQFQQMMAELSVAMKKAEIAAEQADAALKEAKARNELEKAKEANARVVQMFQDLEHQQQSVDAHGPPDMQAVARW